LRLYFQREDRAATNLTSPSASTSGLNDAVVAAAADAATELLQQHGQQGI